MPRARAGDGTELHWEERGSGPTVLLVATMIRLTLNLSSTRLILTNGHAGTHAAGDIIEAFGTLVMGGNFVIGIVVFIILAIALDKLTEYFTSTHFSPVKETSRSAQTGSATTILSGLALGMESSVWAILVIGASILSSVLIFASWAAETQLTAILYGVSLTGIGMLSLTGNTISMDSFGPISDNANGIGEMAGLDKNARNVMDDLDAVGNTTKAVTKGIAIGSAVIAAVAGATAGSLAANR